MSDQSIFLNSKPFCFKLTDIDDIDVLTPDHFLLVERLVAIKEPTTEDFLMNRLGCCSPDFSSISDGANENAFIGFNSVLDGKEAQLI
jgi:hypothetical protein